MSVSFLNIGYRFGIFGRPIPTDSNHGPYLVPFPIKTATGHAKSTARNHLINQSINQSINQFLLATNNRSVDASRGFSVTAEFHVLL